MVGAKETVLLLQACGLFNEELRRLEQIIVRSPKLLEIGAELARSGIPVDEALDELEVLQRLASLIADRFTRGFERNMWTKFVQDGLPAGEVRALTESIRRLGLLAESVVDVTLLRALRLKENFQRAIEMDL